jgi:hypothetical protein
MQSLEPIQSSVQWVALPEAVFLWINQLGQETNHTSPFSPEVKNEQNYTSMFPHVFIVWYLVKYKRNLTFTFYVIQRSFSEF